MGFIKNVFRYLAREITGVQPVQIESAPRRNYNLDLISIGQNPLAVATVYRCINFLSDSVANLPFQYLRKREGIFVEDTDCSLTNLLRVQPNDSMSAFEMMKLAVQYMLVDGNAYIMPLYDGLPEVQRLVLLNRHTVSVDRYSKEYNVSDELNGIVGTYSGDMIIHLKNFSLDGVTGVGTIAQARSYIEMAHTAQAESARRVKSGGLVKGIISNDSGVRGFGEYADKELSKTAIDFNERFNEHGQNIVSVPGSATFTQVSLSAADMQFLESVKLNLRDICRMFGVHPSFVFDDTSTNYKSSEMANLAYLQGTLNPLLVKIEQEFLRKLAPASLWNKRRFRFDRRGLLAGDLNSMAKYQADSLQAGIYTVNEWRKIENKPPVEGGDQAFVSANLRPLTDYLNQDNNQKK